MSAYDPTQTFSLDGLPFHSGLFPLYARLGRSGLCGRRARRDLRGGERGKRSHQKRSRFNHCSTALISSSVVKRPRLKRTAPKARSPSMPMAVSTGEGSTCPE